MIKRETGVTSGHYFQAKKNPPHLIGMEDLYKKEFGGDLLSHQVALAVPSALKSLTAVFGMGTGVTSSLLPPKIEDYEPADSPR